MYSLYHQFSKIIYPYNKTIIDFDRGKYRVIWTPISIMIFPTLGGQYYNEFGVNINLYSSTSKSI